MPTRRQKKLTQRLSGVVVSKLYEMDALGVKGMNSSQIFMFSCHVYV